MQSSDRPSPCDELRTHQRIGQDGRHGGNVGDQDKEQDRHDGQCHAHHLDDVQVMPGLASVEEALIEVYLAGVSGAGWRTSARGCGAHG